MQYYFIAFIQTSAAFSATSNKPVSIIMPLLLHTRYNNIKIIVTWTVLHVFFCHEVFKGEAGIVFVGLLIITILKNLLSHFFFGFQQHKENLYFVPCCVCAQGYLS